MPSENTDPSGYDTSEELKLAPDMAQSPYVLGKAQGSFFDADDVAPEFLDENGKELLFHGVYEGEAIARSQE
ncbi:hypothetical protein MVLG_00148 [Microbotryum lychnidis-dioicae p1A1 Lamole]|uniref:Uncharacterized protein n=1 Tax=Microbotryum lychnidis-dioicae (strain p1A1 Lamole / MvSl-1064) TaxID=683840 RepID=U5GY79_USTV1|nr:hypothetical protein MVLG_00148 [Microbotryum lychnidis-dioicae p1A1 Lamole]|eukprot:KDE09748.1 hypothetical protein MVLG_00148 [Microbotryum lychnidis-dioicae p1A1 Lamole]